MGYLNKVIRRIRQGALRDILEETRWIYGYARQYRKWVALYILLGLLSTGVGLWAGLVSRELINLVVEGTDQGGKIAGAAGAFVAMGLGRVVLSAVISRVSAYVDLHVNMEIRADVFGRFMNTGWQSISQYHTGDLVLRLQRDVSTVASSVLGWVPGLVTSLVQFLGTLLVILYFDPSMAIFALVGVPVSTGLVGFLAPKLRKCGMEVQEASGELNSFYTDSIQNIQSVKAFGLVGLFSEKLHGLQTKHLEVSLRQNRVSVGASALMGVAAQITGYLCLGWGVWRLWNGKIDFGTMVLFIQLAGYLSSAATSLIQLGPAVINATVSAKRLMAVLELPREQVEPAPEKEILQNARDGVTVTLEQVSFSYRLERPVLRDVDFVARPGTVTAVVGPSGSGKTTLLRVLLCLISPEQGNAVLSGGGVEAALQPGLRELFSYVPQQKALFSGTVAETLRLVKQNATEEEMWRVLRMVELEDVVRHMPQGLSSPIGEDGGRLSQGQGQRLSIARALLRDAPILLLDEATSALDADTERRVLHNIMEYGRDKTVVLTTHRPSVLSLCQRVYEIREGKAVLREAEETEAV